MLMPQELDPVLEEPYPELTKNIATDLLPPYAMRTTDLGNEAKLCRVGETFGLVMVLRQTPDTGSSRLSVMTARAHPSAWH